MNQIVEYAALLVAEQFGKEVESVARQLISKGRQTLKTLLKQTKLPAVVVKSSVAVLIHHHIVFTSEDPKRGDIVYTAVIDHILLRAQLPALSTIANTDYGPAGQWIIHALALHGRCTYPFLEQEALKASQVHAEPASQTESTTASAVQGTFKAMVTSGLIVEAFTCDLEVCQPARVVHGGDDSDDGVGSKVTGVKRKKPGDDTVARGSSNVARRARSIRPVDTCTSPEIIWRLDFDCARKHLRRDAYVRLITGRYGEREAAVLRAAMRASEQTEPVDDPSRSVTITVAAVHEALSPKIEIDRVAIMGIMNSFLDDTIKFLSRGQSDKTPGYVISYEALLSYLKTATVEAAIQVRYGIVGARVFRLLRARPLLEQKHIADLVMVPEKETRRQLYRLVQGEMVRIHDIPRTPDHAPSRTFYLFHVDANAVTDKIATDLSKIARNIKIRIRHELEVNRSLVASASQNPPPATAAAATLWTVADRLERALFRVEQQFVILRERLGVV